MGLSLDVSTSRDQLVTSNDDWYDDVFDDKDDLQKMLIYTCKMYRKILNITMKTITYHNLET